MGLWPFTLDRLRSFTVPVSPKTTWIFIELVFTNGPSGWGEATLAGAEEAVLAEIEHASTLLADRRFGGVAEAVAALDMAQSYQPRITVMRAVEQAFLDTLARRSGMPLVSLLGGPGRRAVPVYANINRGIADRSPAGFAARARAVLREEGYHAVKIAPFDKLNWAQCDARTSARLLAEGIERIGAVREAMGPSAALLVDCHSRLSPVMARDVLKSVGNAGLYWLEEPLDEQAFDAWTGRALRSFANDRGIRIAGGERLSTTADMRDHLARGICDAVLPDLRWTGVRTGMAMLELAAGSGVGVSLHNPVGPVLDRISIHVAAALPSLLMLERQVRESPLFEEIRGGRQTLVDGAIALDDSAGFGPEPARRILEHYAEPGFLRTPTLAGSGSAGGDA